MKPTKPTKRGLYWYRRFKRKFNPWDVVRVFCNQEARMLFFELIGTQKIEAVGNTEDSDWGGEVKRETN